MGLVNYFFISVVITTVETASHCSLNWSNDEVEFQVGNCRTCNVTTCAIATGVCRFDLSSSNPNISVKEANYMLSASSCEDLNEVMCGPFNREGLLCSQCKQGYGPPLYSQSLKCEKCSDEHVAWLWTLYLLLELVPITIFYLLVIIFNIRTTSPPFTALVFFCQLFAVYFKIDTALRVAMSFYSNKILFRLCTSLISIWNLDIFRNVFPSFCVSSKLSDLDAALFQYLPIVYSLLLVVVTFICIELHARNCCVVVTLWKPFHKCFVKFKRSIDPRASVITAFATVITLSFTKALYVTSAIIFPGKYLENETLYKMCTINPHIRANNTRLYFKELVSESIAPLVLMIIVFTTFLCFSTLLLLLYPVKCFRKLLTYCGPKKYHAIYVFMDTFMGHYKDGTNGTRDYRAAAITSFLLRIVVCIALDARPINRVGTGNLAGGHLLVVYCLIITSLFYSLVRPCKQNAMNIMESLLYGMASMILLHLRGTSYVSPYYDTRMISRIVFNIVLVIISMPSAVFFVTFSKKPLVQFLKGIRKRATPDSSTLADRLVNPFNYTQL